MIGSPDDPDTPPRHPEPHRASFPARCRPVSDALQILGPEHGKWCGWPAGALVMYMLVTDEQGQLWRASGSPKPAREKLMKDIDAVMYAAMDSGLGATLEAADPHILSDWQEELRAHQRSYGML